MCQEYREMRNHLEENTSSVTIVEPPPIQEMNAHVKHEASHAKQEAETSSGKEIVPVIYAVEMQPSSS